MTKISNMTMWSFTALLIVSGLSMLVYATDFEFVHFEAPDKSKLKKSESYVAAIVTMAALVFVHAVQWFADYLNREQPLPNDPKLRKYVTMLSVFGVQLVFPVASAAVAMMMMLLSIK